MIYMYLQESQILSEGFLMCLWKLTVQWTALNSEVLTHRRGVYIILDATAPLINFIDWRRQMIYKSLSSDYKILTMPNEKRFSKDVAPPHFLCQSNVRESQQKQKVKIQSFIM